MAWNIQNLLDKQSIKTFLRQKKYSDNHTYHLVYLPGAKVLIKDCTPKPKIAKTLGRLFDIPTNIIEQKDANIYLVPYDGQNRRKQDLITINRIKPLSEQCSPSDVIPNTSQPEEEDDVAIAEADILREMLLIQVVSHFLIELTEPSLTRTQEVLGSIPDTSQEDLTYLVTPLLLEKKFDHTHPNSFDEMFGPAKDLLFV